jgi:glycosyltransferase involved in cell wall biosynthesis
MIGRRHGLAPEGVLIGHPTGTPFAHHGALAHLERNRLTAFCVPWMPSRNQLRVLRRLGMPSPWLKRLERRRFEPLLEAPKVQGRWREVGRLSSRVVLGPRVAAAVTRNANRWVMDTMSRELERLGAGIVHSYEDCSLRQFRVARRLGRRTVLEQPIAYYRAWRETLARLTREHESWAGSAETSAQIGSAEQKDEELRLAELVLAPSRYVLDSLPDWYRGARALAPYGVDLDFWTPAEGPRRPPGALRCLYAGHLSMRKGTPLLIEAWRAAALPNATLDLVGPWLLAPDKRRTLPANVRVFPPASPEALREHYRNADLFLFPSYFEGFGLVILEALACGTPVIATTATAGPEVLSEQAGAVFEAGSLDELVALLCRYSAQRDGLEVMRSHARRNAERCGWSHYRERVSEAIDSLIGATTARGSLLEPQQVRRPR